MANEVVYVPRGKSTKQENRFKWTLAALLVVILLLIILIGILSIYVNFNGKSLCTTKECLQSAAALISSMDSKYDPCDNFYKFACGKFEETNFGHVDPLDEYTNLAGIKYRLNHIIQKFLEQPLSKKDAPPIKMVKKFYKACNNESSREELGYSAMDKYLLQAGLPKVPTVFTLPTDRWETYTFDWVKTAVAMKRTFGIDLFVNVANEKGEIYVVAALEPPKLPQLFSDQEIALYDKLKIAEALKNEFKLTVVHVISEVLALEKKINNYGKILDKASEAIWNTTLEVFFANKLVGGGKDYGIRKGEVRNISFSDLQNVTDIMLREHHLPVVPVGQDWRTYVTVLFKEITGKSLNVTGSDVVYYFEKELPYIVATPLLLAKTPDVMLELFAWWKAVFLMITSTTKEIEQTLNMLLYSVAKSKASDCIDLTSERFNSAIGFGIVTEEFLTQTKPEVEEFVESLREAFLERLLVIDWIDEATREVAIKKLHAMKVFVGAPNWIVNETHVMNEYSMLNINDDTHLDNLMQIVQHSVAVDYGSYFDSDTEDEETSDHYGSVSEVNAYYNTLSSSIIIPWSILHTPVYHLGLKSLNYGALGTVIGHEIIHGFDGTGRYYDEESNFRNWWTQQSLANFEEKAKCFVKHYDTFKIRIGETYFKIDGNNTLDENMADNGGMRVAYYALKKYLKKRGAELQLPGFTEFTSEQLFFLTHAHLWCLAEGSDGEQLITRLDEHAPNDVRINGIAQNTPEFSEAFNCPLGSKMNPKRKRCDMW